MARWVGKLGDALEELVRQVARGAREGPKGGVLDIRMLHDDECVIWTKGNECNCDPDVDIPQEMNG